MDVEKINKTREAIEELRRAISNRAEAEAVCAVLHLLNERLVALEQETNPGNAFIPFVPAATATPIR